MCPRCCCWTFRANQGGAFLVFFYLVLAVQTCMVVQHLLGRRFPHQPVAPAVSQSFSGRAWLAGVAVGGLVGGLLSFITLFKPGQALAWRCWPARRAPGAPR